MINTIITKLFSNRWSSFVHGILFSIIVIFSGQIHADTYTELAKIEAQAGSLENLLESKTLLNQYFVLLQNYYGKDRFPRENFDVIAKKLKLAIKKNPALGKRLWETTNLGQEIRITAVGQGSGLQINRQEWQLELQSWITKLEQQASDILKINQPEQRSIKLENILEKLSSEVRQFESSLLAETFSKKTLGLQRADFYKTLSTNPELKAAASYLLVRYLKDPAQFAKFQNSETDVILNALDDLRNAPLSVLHELIGGTSFPKELGFALRQQILDPTELVKREELFTQALVRTNRGELIPVGRSKAGEHVFRPVLRRIMGVWKGIFTKECVGGVCDKDSGQIPSLERVLTIAINESQVLNLEINGRYSGYVNLIPVEFAGQTVASIEFMAQPLVTTLITIDPVTGKKKASKLLDLFYEQAMKHKPAHWAGFALGSLRFLGNANALDTALASPLYVFGTDLGKASYYEVADPLAHEIPNLERPTGRAAEHTGNMIFDAKIEEHMRLTLLAYVPPYKVQKFISDPIQVAQYFATTHNEVQLSGMAQLIADSATKNPAIQAVLTRELVINPYSPGIWTSDIPYRDVLDAAVRSLSPKDPIALKPILSAIRANHLDSELVERLKPILITAMTDNPAGQLELIKLLENPQEDVRKFVLQIISHIHVTDEKVISFMKERRSNVDPLSKKALSDALALTVKESSKQIISASVFNTLIKQQIKDPQQLFNLGQYIIFKGNYDEATPRVQTQLSKATALIKNYCEQALQQHDQRPETLALSQLLQQIDPKLRNLAKLYSDVQPKAPVTPEKVDGTENLQPGSKQFLANEQVLHPKKLFDKGTFNVAGMDPAYLQENTPKFPLAYYLIPEESGEFVRTDLLSENIERQISTIIDGKKYFKLFVHPLAEDYFDYLKKYPEVKYVSKNETEFMAATTSSYRTVKVWNKTIAQPSFMVKLSANVYEGGTHRLVEDGEVLRSTQNQRALEKIGFKKLLAAKLKIFPETAGLILKRKYFANGPEILGGQLIREIPAEVQNGTRQWISLGSLASPEKPGQPLIMDVIHRSGLSSEAFVKKYLVDTFMETYKKIALEQGLAYQPSGQNLYLETFANLAPTGFFSMRDAEGIYPDIIQTTKSQELNGHYSGATQASGFRFDWGRVYAVHSYIDNYRDFAFKQLLMQIKKYDPNFTNEKIISLVQDIDNQFLDMTIKHFKIPRTPDLHGPVTKDLVATLAQLITENIHFEKRADHSRIIKNRALLQYISDSIEQGKADAFTLSLESPEEWYQMDIYISDMGLEFVNSKGLIAGMITFNSEELATRNAKKDKNRLPLKLAPAVDERQKAIENDTKSKNKKIVDEFLNLVPSQTKPVIVFMAGGYGTGKTSVRKELTRLNVLPENHFLVIDVDEIREKIPRYQELKKINVEAAIKAVEFETYSLTMQILKSALRQRKSIVLDQSLSALSIPEEILAEFPNYKSAIIYVESSPSIVEQRVHNRGIETGRTIPMDIVKKSSIAVTKTVHSLSSTVDFVLNVQNDNAAVIKSIQVKKVQTSIELPLAQGVSAIFTREATLNEAGLSGLAVSRLNKASHIQEMTTVRMCKSLF